MGVEGWSNLAIVMCIIAVFWDNIFEEKKKK